MMRNVWMLDIFRKYNQWYDLTRWMRASLGSSGVNQIFQFELKLETSIKYQNGKVWGKND